MSLMLRLIIPTSFIWLALKYLPRQSSNFRIDVLISAT